jgi:hypothetical protein
MRWWQSLVDSIEQSPCILDERPTRAARRQGSPSSATKRCSRAMRSRRSSPTPRSRLIARWSTRSEPPARHREGLWIPVIAVELVPVLAGGDRPEQPKPNPPFLSDPILS